MGYRTWYTINIENDADNEKFAKVRESFEDILEHLYEDGSPHTDVSWHDFEEDMRLISSTFPDYLFEVHGEGEESEDKWDAYFLNGKHQHCQAEISYPPYDPAKLN